MPTNFSLTSSITLPERVYTGSEIIINFTVFNSSQEPLTGIDLEINLDTFGVEFKWPTATVGLVPVGAFASGFARYTLTESDFTVGVLTADVTIEAEFSGGSYTEVSSITTVVTETEVDSYASIDDLQTYYRLIGKWDDCKNINAATFLEEASDKLRIEFTLDGKDLDGRIAERKTSLRLVKGVIVRAVAEALKPQESSSSSSISQVSQSAGPYSVSYSNPFATDQRIWFSRKDLRILGISKYQIGTIKLNLGKPNERRW